MTRRRGAALGAAVIAVAAAAAFLLSTSRSARPPRVTILQDDAVLLHRGAAGMHAGLRDLRALGVDWVRVTASWSAIAPAPRATRRPRFDARDPAAYPRRSWAALDRLMRGAGARRLRVMIDIAFWAPRWAVRSAVRPAERQRSQIDPRAYADFAAAVARRYSGRYDGLPAAVGFTVWNEPNYGVFLLPQWRREGTAWEVASADAYRAMLYAAYPAIHRAAPGALVLIGATSAIGADSPTSPADGVAPLRFLRALACVDRALRPVHSGGCRDFRPLPGDGWAHHPYTPGDPSLHDTLPDDVPIADLPRLSGLLERLHARGRTRRRLGVWVTEFGYQTDPPDPTQRVSPDEQASFIPQAERIAAGDPAVRSFAQFLLRDLPPARSGDIRARWSDYQSGVRYAAGAAKPAFDALRWSLVAYRRADGSVGLWGHVRPQGATATRVEARAGAGRAWRIVARPSLDAHGYLRASLEGRPEAAYRLAVRTDGRWRAAPPIRLARAGAG
jgi:hypothetical protein